MQPSPFTKQNTRKKARSQVLTRYLIKKVLVNRAGSRCAKCYRKTVPVRLARIQQKKGCLAEDGYCLLCHDCIKARQQQRKQARKRLWRRKASNCKITKGGFLNRVRNQVLERDNYTCVWCYSKEKIGLGPLIPESRGGKLEFNNYVTTCQKCRPSKGNKLPLEFIGEDIFIDEYLNEQLNEHLRLKSDPGKNTSIRFSLLAEISEFLHKLNSSKAIPDKVRIRAERLDIKLLS